MRDSLDEFDLARVYYQLGLTEFASLGATGGFTWLIYGDVNQKRIEFIGKRLQALGAGEKPDFRKFLDGEGREQLRNAPPVAAAQADAAASSSESAGVLSYLSPTAWYRWYYSTSPADEQRVEV